MKLNKKGFTLIESIITFAILAIAGGMFILGFYNVSVIASEGSIIKTETNDLYNSVISREPDDLAASYSLTFTFDDNLKSELKCWTIEEESKLGSDLDPFTIRLLRCVPADTLNDWAEPETTDDEMVDATIRFHLRWPMMGNQNDYPCYEKDSNGNDKFINLTQYSSGGVTHNHYIYESKSIKINKNAISSSYNEEYVLKSLNNPPSKNDIKSVNQQYYGNDIIWFQIQKQSDSTFDVIGFEIPPGPYTHRTVVMYKNGYDVRLICDLQGTDWNYGALNGPFSSVGNNNSTAKSILDGKSYTSREIYDNRDKNKINIYTIEK